ncbi:hypothetical protein TNCV_1299931 [Trichonephila clavipes]|nr:hypothetical protein TNCV_1299931 [Trichonephila clavipes]
MFNFPRLSDQLETYPYLLNCLHGMGVLLNSRRTTSSFGRLGEERWEAPDHTQGVLPQNWGGTERNRTVTYMVLESKANDRRKNIALSHDVNFVYLETMKLSIR